MRKNIQPVILFFCLLISIFFLSFQPLKKALSPEGGSWHWQEGSQEAIISFMDGYCAFTSYDQQHKKFDYTWGGPYKLEGTSIIIELQFHSRTKELAGTVFSFSVQFKNEQLIASFRGGDAANVWIQKDKGKAPLAGIWRIAGRKQGDQLTEMQLGSRRTLKILSASRFQWAAINIETKEFFGTGGGSYRFENGKYIESIEFFSRDSSRVGASLSFDGKIENNEWHHSGLSSKGEPIYEIWKRIN